MPMVLRNRGDPKSKPGEDNNPPATTAKQTRDRNAKKTAATSKTSASASSSSLGTSQSSQESLTLSILKPHAKAIHDAFAAALNVPGAEEWKLSAEALLNKVRSYAAEAEQRRGQPLELLLPKTPMGKMMMSSTSRRPAKEERDPIMEDSMGAIPEVIDLESEVENAGPSGSQDSSNSTVETKPKKKQRKPVAQKISIPASPYHTRQRVTRLQAKLRRGSAASSTTTDTGRSSAGSQKQEPKGRTKTKKKVQEEKKQETKVKASKSAPRDVKKRKIDEEQVQPQTITSVPVDFNFEDYGKVNTAVKKRRMDGSEGAEGSSEKQEQNETTAASNSPVKEDSVSALAREVDRKLKIKPTVRVTRLPSLVFREKLPKELSPPADTPLTEPMVSQEATEDLMDTESPKTPRRSERLRTDNTTLKPLVPIQNAGTINGINLGEGGGTFGNEHALLTEDESDNTLQDEDKSFKTATAGGSSRNGSSDSVEFEFEMSLTATPESEVKYFTPLNSTIVIKPSHQPKPSEAKDVGNSTFAIPPARPQEKPGEGTCKPQKASLLNGEGSKMAAEKQPGTSALNPSHEQLNGTYVVPNGKSTAPSLATKFLGKYMNTTYAVEDSPSTNTFPRSSNSRNKPELGATFVQPKAPSLIPRARSGAFSSPQGSPTSSKLSAATKSKPSKQPSTSSSSTVTDGSSDTTSRPASAASQSSVKENMQSKPSKFCGGLVQTEKKRIETQDHLARMEQKQKLQEKQEAAEKKREQHLKDRADYQRLQNRAWAERVIKPKEHEQPGRTATKTTGYVHEIALKFGNSGLAKPSPHLSSVPKHLKVPIPVASSSSCPDINKNSGAVPGSSMNKGVSAGNIWTGISSTISSAMAFVKPQAPNKLPVIYANSKAVDQEKKFKAPPTPPDSCLDETFQSCDTTFNSTQDVNVSTYDITFFEDYDENLAHRENKRIPKWASDSEKLKRCLFMQQPKYIAMLEREVLPPQKIGYKIFPRRRDVVEEDE